MHIVTNRHTLTLTRTLTQTLTHSHTHKPLWSHFEYCTDFFIYGFYVTLASFRFQYCVPFADVDLKLPPSSLSIRKIHVPCSSFMFLISLH